tara:strand:+ start:43 stop:372 length:330 start_codon:yes stop_codon:yes gene_type:complete
VVTTEQRLESINRINIMERGEEAVARGDITQEQLNESLRIFNETKSMDAANEYIRKQKKSVTNKDAAIMKAEKQRRARAKGKAKPMGKKQGGIINSRAIARKYFKGGLV